MTRCSPANGRPKYWWNDWVPSGGLRTKSRPKKVGRGMPAMPFGPPVACCQFSSTMRMISPKPSVTMAR
jgi:hypothetical protein